MIYIDYFRAESLTFCHKAIARAYRYGQKKTCLVFKLMVKDSAEGMLSSLYTVMEKILNILLPWTRANYADW